MYPSLSRRATHYLVDKPAYHASRALQKLGKRDVVGWAEDRDQCDIDYNPPGFTDDLYGRIAGPWRTPGKNHIMHGIYWRPASSASGWYGDLDGMAVLNGWRIGTWRGPSDMTLWSHPLVNYWTELLSTTGRLGLTVWLDSQDYAFESVLEGRSVYARVACSRREFEAFAERVDNTARYPLAYSYLGGRMAIGRTETLNDLFGAHALNELASMYREVLNGAPRFSDHVAYCNDVIGINGLTNAGRLRPSEFVPKWCADNIWQLPEAVQDLMYGRHPMVTAGRLQRMYAHLPAEENTDQPAS